MTPRYPKPLPNSWGRILGLGAFAGVLSIWAWFPMLVQYPRTATLDGRYFHHQVAIAKAGVLRYHELPLWNAFDCRGIPMWDHPENITASPLFWLTLPLTATTTIIVWHLVHAAAGFIGMWLLARHDLRLSREATLVAATTWAYAACHTTQYAGGHEALISFYNAPLLLFLWRRAERDWSSAVGCGLVLAWMAYDGATYPLPHTVLMLGIEGLLRCWPAKRALRIAGAAAVVGLTCVSVGAARIFPLAIQLASHKRILEYPDVDHLSFPMLVDMYTLRSTGYLMRLHDQQYVFGEYLTYIGWLGVLLCVIGVVASAAETTWLAGLALVLALLMAGHFGKMAPWTFLHEHVFPFRSMRVPARFRILLLVPICLWIASSVDRVPELVSRWSRRWSDVTRTVLLGLGLLVAGDTAGLGQELIPPRFSGPPEQKLPSSTRFHYGGAGLGDAIDQPRQNHAYTGCRAAWAWYADAPVWEGDQPQARATGPEATVEVANRTHNSFTLDVDVKADARVLLNSAYDRGWRTDTGRVVEQNHLLALDLPPGRHRVHVRYWPPLFSFGLVLSAIGIAASLAFLFRRDLEEVLRARRARVGTKGD